MGLLREDLNDLQERSAGLGEELGELEVGLTEDITSIREELASLTAALDKEVRVLKEQVGNLQYNQGHHCCCTHFHPAPVTYVYNNPYPYYTQTLPNTTYSIQA